MLTSFVKKIRFSGFELEGEDTAENVTASPPPPSTPTPTPPPGTNVMIF
jgi:hypothetical protein